MEQVDELTFAPLGGVGEIGMNLSIYGLGNRRRSWLAVDLGVSFGDEEHLPGIETIMPDISFLEQERKNLVGLVLTHAHEDHFGAVLDLWPRLQCPIYATKFSAALFEAKCASERNPPKIPVTVIPSGGRIDLGPFNVEFRSRTRYRNRMRWRSTPRPARFCTPATGRSIRRRSSVFRPTNGVCVNSAMPVCWR